ncbi:hypothetical protein MPTK1_7g06040 [Marchantia polymorpha subsp. ruderalis]|uniref:Uncharacterized protein n=2 Tax=Marchantia polymorpha TaxID=3197 RepID=A0AAF6BWM6_MARPO|nr:hypothetical protein MARPO_0057s0067 [Marchantia polymorpha]BBN16410.1 hypothetical protein Mp_7g06040 [Marchantia polymorpha subsp. ruderalis]|eukprot:PTQ37432.1 hypothetical protein MARPO_0057s0067 [Marchantia polymorpha]
MIGEIGRAKPWKAADGHEHAGLTDGVREGETLQSPAPPAAPPPRHEGAEKMKTLLPSVHHPRLSRAHGVTKSGTSVLIFITGVRLIAKRLQQASKHASTQVPSLVRAGGALEHRPDQTELPARSTCATLTYTDRSGDWRLETGSASAFRQNPCTKSCAGWLQMRRDGHVVGGSWARQDEETTEAEPKSLPPFQQVSLTWTSWSHDRGTSIFECQQVHTFI